MAAFDEKLAAEIGQHAQTQLSELIAALERTFSSSNTKVTLAEPRACTPAELSTIAGVGLALALEGETRQAVFLLPQAGGYLPSWYTPPDATQKNRLDKLASQLGSLLLPESWKIREARVTASNDLAAAVLSAGLAEDAGCLPFTIEAATGSCTGLLVWSIEDTYKWMSSIPVNISETPAIQKAATATPAPESLHRETRETLQEFTNYEQLPKYTRSLLRIDVPLRVVLAEKKQLLSAIMDLGPGSIIQFDKSCEELLELNVENQTIAQGEAVKVGDKFGLRITHMVLPEERFLTIKGTISR